MFSFIISSDLSQVNKLKRIVIASVLKPVDESRMFEKIGLSLGNQGQFEVHLIGSPFPSANHPEENLFLHPIGSKPFGRLSFKRFIAPFIILRKALSIKPDVFIITTHELLLVSILCRMIIGCKVLYDVQENYFRNIRYTTAFPPVIRQILAIYIRLKEIICSPFIYHFILAESVYKDELSFAKPYVIVQNKLAKKVGEVYRKQKHSGYTNLLFSGTLAESTGVFEAIEIAKNLHELDASFTLTIIGSCHVQSDHEKLKQLADKLPFVRYLGQPHPIPHPYILKEIQQSDFGIVYYPPNPSTRGSMPTKVYEYSGLNLPFLVRHETSHDYVLENNAGIILSEVVDYQALINNMKAFQCGPLADDIYFETEFQSVLNILVK